MTTDGVIDGILGELIADVQDDRNPFVKDIHDRLLSLRTQLRSGRGDDAVGLADPIEALAKAGYRAHQLIVRQMTPPVWEYVDDHIRKAWMLWAQRVVDTDLR